MVTADGSIAEMLDREVAAGIDLLDGLTTTDRIHFRSAVDQLSGAIDEIRGEWQAIEETDPGSRLGPLLADRVEYLLDMRLRLLFAVVFPGFELIEPPGSSGASNGEVVDNGNIVVDGEVLAHDTLF